LPSTTPSCGVVGHNNTNACKKIVKGMEPGEDAASCPKKIVKSIARAQQIKKKLNVK
jgi:hypothetical protein